MADPLTIVKQCMRHLGSSVDFLGRHHPEALEEVAGFHMSNYWRLRHMAQEVVQAIAM